MPLSKIRLEVEFCLDAEHAQDELTVLVQSVLDADKKLELELTGDSATPQLDDPEYVLESMKDEVGLSGSYWRGRVSAAVSSGVLLDGSDPTGLDRGWQESIDRQARKSGQRAGR